MNSEYDFSIIRLIRKRLDLTLKELAKVSGLTYPTVETVEANKAAPSLKTLDALAGALQISTSHLLSMAEKKMVQKRKAITLENLPNKGKGLYMCKIAAYDGAKMIRLEMEEGHLVNAMGLHANVNEFCYVLSGSIELTIAGTTHILKEDDTMLFNGMLEHQYVATEASEVITVHIPKDINMLESLLIPKK
jgi:transcriptional regulator with XRE-family HTH domain